MILEEFLKGEDERVMDFVFEDEVLVEYVGKDEKVFIPEGVREIGINAFWNNQYLKQVVLPDSLERIHAGAFAGTNLEQLVLPRRLQVLGRRAFEGCDLLEYVRIPRDVFQMTFLTFDLCENLMTIEVAEGNQRYFNQDGMVCARYPMRPNPICLHRCPTGVSGEVILEGKIDVVSEGAFSNCTKVTGVKLPDGLKAIDGVAFYGCDSLKSIALPDSLEEICDGAFERCRNLQSVRLPDGLLHIGEHVFDGCPRLKEIVVSDEALVRYCEEFDLLNEIYLSPAFDSVRERYDSLVKQIGIDEIVDDALERSEVAMRQGSGKDCIEL